MKLASMILASLLALTSAAEPVAAQGDIYLGNVTGLTPGGGISNNIPGAVSFTLNYRNSSVYKASMTNGFEISGSGGISWVGTYGTDPSFPVANFDLIWASPPMKTSISPAPGAVLPVSTALSVSLASDP